MADLEEVRDAFQFLDDWEDRYRFILDLGRSVPQLERELKTDDRLVRGCQSLVWLVPRFDAGEGRLHLKIDSDAHIVRGLIAIVLAAYDGNEPAEILDFDIEGLFSELDLMQHLSYKVASRTIQQNFQAWWKSEGEDGRERQGQ